MLKNICRLEWKANGKDYQFLCDHDSPLTDAKESLFQFQKYLGQIEDQQKAAKEQAEKEAQAKAEESKVEPISEAQNV